MPKIKKDLRSGKQERYIQPSILLELKIQPSYGYELIKKLQRFGFIQGQAPPGMIYRHLRQLEEDGLVSSHWQTEESGPAKRMYTLTDEGHEMLATWIEYLKIQAHNIREFINRYNKQRSPES